MSVSIIKILTCYLIRPYSLKNEFVTGVLKEACMKT